MWYVGLDWADTHHDVVVLDEAGRRVGSRRFAHSHTGLNELKEFVLGIAASPDQLACIVETNHGLLIAFLLEAGIPVSISRSKTRPTWSLSLKQWMSPARAVCPRSLLHTMANRTAT